MVCLTHKNSDGLRLSAATGTATGARRARAAALLTAKRCGPATRAACWLVTGKFRLQPSMKL